MTTLRFYFEGESAASKFQRNNQKAALNMNRAMLTSAQQTAETIETRGRADIAGAGKFGGRWTAGLHAKVSRGGGNIRLAVTHSEKYFGVFERGARIAGRPLLWLPIGGGGGSRGSAGQTYASSYPGKLFRIKSSSGRPLLMDAGSKQVKYVGVTNVTIPRKFHIRDIIRQEATRLKERYAANFAAGGGK